MDDKSVVIIQLPASDTLQSVGLRDDELESLVLGILGGQEGRGINHVILKGGQASGGPGVESDWDKTIWSRDC